MDKFYERFDILAKEIEGDAGYDTLTRTIYSTDASAYRELPTAVVWPKNATDIKRVLSFARNEGKGLTIRAAGTSLAGQVVTQGIIADISKYMNSIIEINEKEKWVRVEPGVVLDELNLSLKSKGLFFGPETSTSNRCNIGGMVGNNACGSHSLVYGSTRDHLFEIKGILSDGSEVVFGPVTMDDFKSKCNQSDLEGEIYSNISSILSDETNQREIRDGYPDPSIKRRNTGYALDLLLNSEIFTPGSNDKFNFCNLVAGSEGTLVIATEIKLGLVELPLPHKALVCVHLEKRSEAFLANLVALKFKPTAVEMMDDTILSLTEGSLSQRENRFFLEGKPGAILIVEFALETPDAIDKVAKELTEALKKAGYGYAYPVVRGKDISKVWNLRKAGLGVLSNMVGDAKPVSLIEDTAVNVEKLPGYIADFEEMLSKYNKEVVYHAHIGTGELHIRPVLDLKDKLDAEHFRSIGRETALLVKKYRGSLSGEHGDGRLRGEFIPLILGEHNYGLLKLVKNCWDPYNVLNPGKITDTPPMDSSLRYFPGVLTNNIETIFDFSESAGIVRAAERCNGSGDCRKSSVIGGTMCPTFMATGEEDKSTRARANMLREALSSPNGNHWDSKEVYEVLDTCISCKGCKSECPSSVDIAKLKAEYMQHWYDKHGIPLRTRMIAYITTFNKIGSYIPYIYNFFLRNRITSGLMKRILRFAPQRSMPLLSCTTLRKWVRKNNSDEIQGANGREVYLFIDEFTDYNDADKGIAAVRLLNRLGYKVNAVNHDLSARTFFSKGLLRTAKKIVRRNVSVLSSVVSAEKPLIGIEPSAILGFRDEYPEIVGSDLKEKALQLARNTMLLEEFIVKEFTAGRITREQFIDTKADVLLHAHCQQKAVASSACTIDALSIPAGYNVKEIPSGCCGMAGSFGYEAEHFDLSNKIGEMVLFPAVRDAAEEVIIAAPGTSCRHHIKDGTGRIAYHPAEILFRALR